MTKGHIIVGVSTSPAADAALRWALTKADRTGSAVVAVHVYDEKEHADLALEVDRQAAVRESHQRVQLRASAIASELDFAGSLWFRPRYGDLATELVDEAVDGTAIAVGVPQRDLHEEFLPELASQAHCPVVAVAADGVPTVVGLPLLGTWPAHGLAS